LASSARIAASGKSTVIVIVAFWVQYASKPT